MSDTFLGFDYGTRRIGVAVGQKITANARGLCTIKNQEPKLWETISALVNEWQPDGFVVGMTTHADGTETALSEPIKRFCYQLEGRFTLPVATIDERLSSVAAQEHSTPRRGRPQALDAIAAAIILETWLAEQETE